MLITFNSADLIVYFMIKKSDFLFVFFFHFVADVCSFLFFIQICLYSRTPVIFQCKVLVFHLQSILHWESINHGCKFQLVQVANEEKKRKLKVIIIFVTLYFPMLPWEMRHRLNSITMLIQIDCGLNQRETRANIRKKRRSKKEQVQKSDANWMKNWRRVSRTLLGWVRATFQNGAYIFEGFLVFTSQQKRNRTRM